MCFNTKVLYLRILFFHFACTCAVHAVYLVYSYKVLCTVVRATFCLHKMHFNRASMSV